MAGIIQIYQPSGGYSNCPSAILGDFIARIGLLDDYIIYEASDGWRLAIRNRISGEIESYRADIISYSYNQYGAQRSYYAISAISAPDWDISIYAPTYCYSNIGYGAAAELPIFGAATAYSCMIIASAILLAIVFPRLFRRGRRII